MASVTVVRADGGGVGDSVFIDGRYQQSAGRVGEAIDIAAGQRTFETLGADGNPNWGNTEVINADTTVTLQPVAIV